MLSPQIRCYVSSCSVFVFFIEKLLLVSQTQYGASGIKKVNVNKNKISCGGNTWNERWEEALQSGWVVTVVAVVDVVVGLLL